MDATIIAVLLPGKVGASQMQAHDGASVIAAGRLDKGASIHNSGTEIRVASIKAPGLEQ